MAIKLTNILFSFFLIILASTSFAEFEYSGEIKAELRQFKDDEVNKTVDKAIAGKFRAELKYSGENYNANFRGYALVDTEDNDRNTTTIEDLYFTYFFNEDETVSLTAGYKIFNWSATEAFHPADVINSRNLDSNIESLDKIGEPHIEGYFETSIGSFSLFYFPYAINPKYPGKNSRLGVGKDIRAPIWVTSNTKSTPKNWHHQGALRFSKTIGSGDLTLHAIHHMNRMNPIVGLDITYKEIMGFSAPVRIDYTPYFFKALQLGGTYQHAIEGGWLIKAEGAFRDFYHNEVNIQTPRGYRSPKDHGLLALGVEYVMSHDIGYESNLVLEAQSVLGQGRSTRSELSLFQRDIMLGYRLAFNDTMGKELFVSLIKDIERKNETLYNFYYTQRLSDDWKVKMGFRVYDAPMKGDYPIGLEAYHNSHYVFLNLSRFF